MTVPAIIGLARMVIDNTGGTAQRGDYRARTLRGRSREALDRALCSLGGGGKAAGRLLDGVEHNGYPS